MKRYVVCKTNPTTQDLNQEIPAHMRSHGLLYDGTLISVEGNAIIVKDDKAHSILGIFPLSHYFAKEYDPDLL